MVAAMDLPAPPRSGDEVKFFVDETPCEHCGQLGFSRAASSYSTGSYEGTCAHCGQRREFHFQPVPADQWPPVFHLGPEGEPSKIFTADQFRAIADRELARAPAAPAELPTLAAFREARAHLEKARTALVELTKFRPDDTALSVELGRVVELGATYKQAEAVVDAKVGAHAKPRGLDGRFAQHRKWLERGRVGDGQLVFRGERWSEISMSTALLSAAIIEDTTFEKIDFSHGTFDETILRRARFLGCDLQMSKFKSVAFEGCDLKGTRLSLADLLDVAVAGGDWQEILGGRSTWRGQFHDVDLRGARLRDSVLDTAVFQRCDLRDADVSRKDAHLTALGTARGTRFVDCDLRGLNLEGWRLDGTIFERCRMHGLVGTPVLEGDVQIIDADLSLGGDGGADAVGSARLAASWRST